LATSEYGLSVSRVRIGPTVAGAILVLLGVLGTQYGTQTYFKDVPTNIVDTFQVGVDVKERDFWFHSFRFEGATIVAGNGTASIVDYGKSNDMNFLVLDSMNFEGWKRRQPGVKYLVEIGQAPTRFDFSFTTAKNDTYYFVFDNYYSTVRREVSLAVRYQYVKITKELRTDYTLAYGAAGLAIVGAIVLTYGVLKKPEIRWA
jgi:hypothetical protein